MDSINLEQVMQQLIPIMTVYGLQIIGAVAILIIGRIVAGVAGSMARRALERGKVDVTVQGFVVTLVRSLVLLIAVIAALSKFGIQTTSFVAVIGAAGLAIGLALQGALANFAAGFLILVLRPFKQGDVIDAGGTKGTVKGIGLFATELTTPDNKKIIVPNGGIMSSTITNVNAHATRRVDLTAGIGYGDDIGKATKALESILSSHELVLAEPAPTIKVVELADSSVNFVVRPWVKTEDYWTVFFDVTLAIKQRFDAEGISIPFPQQDVHMHQVAG